MHGQQVLEVLLGISQKALIISVLDNRHDSLWPDKSNKRLQFCKAAVVGVGNKLHQLVGLLLLQSSDSTRPVRQSTCLVHQPRQVLHHVCSFCEAPAVKHL